MSASNYFYNNKIIKSDRHHVINNAIQVKQYAYNENVRNDMKEELGLKDKYVIGHVGRFQYQKNHEFLIDIFNEYSKLDADAVLMLVGQGENEGSIRDKVKELGIEDNVMFMGVRSDVHKLMQVMDVFLLPSRFEGLPLVLVEAQAAGLKCFTSKDVVSDECNVAQNVEFIDLMEKPECWSDKIYDASKIENDRSEYARKVSEAGFDIHTESGKIVGYLQED